MNTNDEQEISAVQYSSAPKWDLQTTSLVKMGFALSLIALGFVFWAIASLLLSTIVMAYLLTPITNFFTDHITGGRRSIGVFLTFIVLIVTVIAIFLILVPPLLEQSISGVTGILGAIDILWSEPITFGDFSVFTSTDEEPIALSEYAATFAEQQGLQSFNDWIVIIVNTLQLDRQAVQEIATVGGGITSVLVGSVFRLASSTIGFIFSTIFFFTILASLLSDGPRFVDIIVHRVPSGYEQDTLHLLADLGHVWDGYIRGNFIVGVVMGIAMWILATILGLPNPLFLAFVGFAMEFVPSIGAWISMLVAMLMAIVGGSTTFPNIPHLPVALIVGGIWMIMQQIEGLFLVPRIVGENLRLHPMIVILAVIWGGTFGGLAGLIIAPPIVASIRILLQYFYGRLTGQEAFSPPTERKENIFNRLFQRYFHTNDGSANSPELE